MMRLVLVLACLLGLSLAATLERKPQQCESPPFLTGVLTFTTAGEPGWITIPYEYDAGQERVRLNKFLTFGDFTYDVLMLYKEGVMYVIDEKNSICLASPLEDKFEPFGVPPNATLLGSSVIGSLSISGAGLLVNTWKGEKPHGEQYMVTVTDADCVPVSTLTRSGDSDWKTLSYINNINSIEDPSTLDPPLFCNEVQSEDKPAEFFAGVKSMIKNAR